MVEWYEQPDPLIDEYLEELRGSGASKDQVRIHELTVKLFEVGMLGKGLSVFEVTPHYVKCYLVGILARGASATCLRRHWRCLRDYFAFLVDRGLLESKPATPETYPHWGSEASKTRTPKKKPPQRDGLS